MSHTTPKNLPRAVLASHSTVYDLGSQTDRVVNELLLEPIATTCSLATKVVDVIPDCGYSELSVDLKSDNSWLL